MRPGFRNRISMAMWSKISESTLSADDASEVVWADTSDECHARSQEVADKLSEWYRCAGLSLNPKKSEYIPFNYDPGPISVDGTQVEPKKSFKFLGCGKGRRASDWRDETWASGSEKVFTTHGYTVTLCATLEHTCHYLE